MTGTSPKPPIIGIVGWKKSGKTTLVTGLIAEFTMRSLKVATIKHAHHAFQIDQDDTDSAKHRHAGADQVAIVSSKRWALISELEDAPEPSLEQVIAHLGPCDLIIVEGYKAAPIPKIEVRRLATSSRVSLAANDPHIVAIVADHPADASGLPAFALDDVVGIAAFIAQTLNLPSPNRPTAATP